MAWAGLLRRLKQLLDATETQELFCASDGVCWPRLFVQLIEPIKVIHFQIDVRRRQKFPLFQMPQVFANLIRGKDPPDFRYECRKRGGEPGMVFWA